MYLLRLSLVKVLSLLTYSLRSIKTSHHMMMSVIWPNKTSMNYFLSSTVVTTTSNVMINFRYYEENTQLLTRLLLLSYKRIHNKDIHFIVILIVQLLNNCCNCNNCRHQAMTPKLLSSQYRHTLTLSALDQAIS